MSQSTPQEAIGLTYDGEQAPHIACHLRGEDVSRFLSMAEEAGIYVHHDPVLLERLAALPEGETIPPPSTSSLPRFWPGHGCCKDVIPAIGVALMVLRPLRKKPELRYEDRSVRR